MASQVTLSVDAMGGDNAPDVVIEGARRALEEDPDLRILLCGTESAIASLGRESDRCIAVPTTQVISMSEHPAAAVRKKKDSSIVRGCKLVCEGQAQGFFSAGSTGACLTAATLVMGRLKGVKRPALGVLIPAYERPTFLIDVGANADCKPDYLVQFARMGVVYLQSILGVAHPRVGLLNIGEEDTKGSSFALSAYAALSKHVFEFAGNCEGGDLVQGRFDVVVTDGFTGNVCLKTIEGTSKLIFRHLKHALTSSLSAKMGALLVKGDLSALKEELNPDRFGGSPLLGVKGVCMVGHGSSNAQAIKNGILAGCAQVREGVPQRIADALSTTPPSASTESE